MSLAERTEQEPASVPGSELLVGDDTVSASDRNFFRLPTGAFCAGGGRETLGANAGSADRPKQGQARHRMVARLGFGDTDNLEPPEVSCPGRPLRRHATSSRTWRRRCRWRSRGGKERLWLEHEWVRHLGDLDGVLAKFDPHLSPNSISSAIPAPGIDGDRW